MGGNGERYLNCVAPYLTLINSPTLSQIEKHVKSRPQPSIRSHAQKHFIKLFRDGLPLPAKVAESGTGFTLSGKELDVNSASARGYLNAGKVRRQSSSSSTLVAPSPPTMSSTAAAPPPILSSHKFLLPNSAVLHQQGRIISVDKMYKPQDLDLTNFVGVAATTTTTNSSNIASSLPTSKKKKQDDGVKIPSRLQEKNVLSSHTTPVVPITRPRRAASAKNVYGDRYRKKMAVCTGLLGRHPSD